MSAVFFIGSISFAKPEIQSILNAKWCSAHRSYGTKCKSTKLVWINTCLRVPYPFTTHIKTGIFSIDSAIFVWPVCSLLGNPCRGVSVCSKWIKYWLLSSRHPDSRNHTHSRHLFLCLQRHLPWHLNTHLHLFQSKRWIPPHKPHFAAQISTDRNKYIEFLSRISAIRFPNCLEIERHRDCVSRWTTEFTTSCDFDLFHSITISCTLGGSALIKWGRCQLNRNRMMMRDSDVQQKGYCDNIEFANLLSKSS